MVSGRMGYSISNPGFFFSLASTWSFRPVMLRNGQKQILRLRLLSLPSVAVVFRRLIKLNPSAATCFRAAALEDILGRSVPYAYNRKEAKAGFEVFL